MADEVNMNAFEKMMASSKRKADEMEGVDARSDLWYTAVIYRVTLDRMDPSHILFGTPYFGQTVRAGSAEKVAAFRWRKEVGDAAREHKDIGFLAAIEEFGRDAFTWQILETRHGPRHEMREWANQREKALIAEHGGVLRDMEPEKRLKQTFNLTKGGHYIAFEAIDALRTRKWKLFQTELLAHIAEHGTAYVPCSHPTLGWKCAFIRDRGIYVVGHPDEAERRAWLESQPGWYWDMDDSEDLKMRRRENGIAQWGRVDSATRTQWAEGFNKWRKDPTRAADVEAVAEASRQAWVEHRDERRDLLLQAQNSDAMKSKYRSHYDQKLFDELSTMNAQEQEIKIAQNAKNRQTSENRTWLVEILRKHIHPRIAVSELSKHRANGNLRRAYEPEGVPYPDRPATDKRTQDTNAIRATFVPRAKTTELSKYRRDGTLENAKTILALMDDLIACVENVNVVA